MPCRRSLVAVGRCYCCHRCCHLPGGPRLAAFPARLRSLCAAASPIGLTAANSFTEERCQGWLDVYINQAFSPVLVALRSESPLTPYRRCILIRRQSGEGPLHLPGHVAIDQVPHVKPRMSLSPINCVAGMIASLEG